MKRHCLSLALLGLLGLLAVGANAQVTAAPSLMNFQGRLTRPDGTPVANGTYSIRFSLHTAATGGTEKWFQVVNPVTVTNGTFAVLLNTSTGAADKFNSNLWLEIKIGTDAALTPRQQLVSVAYAMKANSVPDGSITSASIANGSITSDKLASNALNNLSWLLGGNAASASHFLGTTNSQPLVFKTNNAERMRLLSDGKLGLNTNSPLALLDIQGGARADGTDDLRNLAFSYFGGGFRHWLRTRHDITTGNGNAIDFFLNTSNTAGGSSAPGTGNIHVMTLGGSGNVGIGTSAPARKLQVGSDSLANSAGIIRLASRSGTGPAGRSWDIGVPETDENLTGSGYSFVIHDADAADNVLTDPNFIVRYGSGYVGIGTANPTSRLHVKGEITAEIMTVLGGSDVAEPYHVASAGDIKAIPGYVVAIDPEKVGQMRVVSKAYDKTVAGIVSGANGINPGITLRQKGTVADGELPVASIGRVWCYCDADANGAIEAGDMLTTSDTPGHAMKVTDHNRANGAVIGKAMSSLKSGKGLVLVLVSLK